MIRGKVSGQSCKPSANNVNSRHDTGITNRARKLRREALFVISPSAVFHDRKCLSRYPRSLAEGINHPSQYKYCMVRLRPDAAWTVAHKLSIHAFIGTGT